MIRNLHLKMQSIILLTLIPALLLVTVMMGGLIYSGLHDIIMDGFAHKLRAISSVSGAFIDGDEHSLILLPRQIKGLALDPKSHILYGADAASGNLMSIDTADGGATDIGPIGFRGIGDLAFDPSTGAIYGISTEKTQLVRIDPRSGARKAVGRLGEAFGGLAFDPAHGVLYAAGRYLARIDPQNAHVQRLGEIGFSSVTALALDTNKHILYGNDHKTGQLIRINMQTGHGVAIRRIRALLPEDAENTIPKTLLPNQALEFDGQKSTFYGSGDRLLTINPETVRAAWETFTADYRNENGPLYLKYVEPMRRIRKTKDVTFMYSQVMGEGTNITYVLDGQTEADAHSNIGAEDNIPETELEGARAVMAHDRVHLTDIKQWQQWGLLKSAWAPIYDHKQTANAMAGTDVDISIIRKKTGDALTKVGLVAVFCLLVGGFIAVYIARSLTSPIARVKDVAIQVASGQYAQRIAIQSPLELSDLASSFNTMSQTLETTVTDLTEDNRSAERKRRRQHLQRELALEAQDDELVAISPNIGYAWLANRANCADSSGAVLSQNGSQLLVWFAEPASGSVSDALQAIKLRSEIAEVMRRALVHSHGDWHVLLPIIRELYSDTVSSFVLLDAASDTLKSYARRSSPVVLFENDQDSRRIDLTVTPELALLEGQSVLLCSSPDALSQVTPDLWHTVASDEVGETASPSTVLAALSRAAEGAEGLAVLMSGKSLSVANDLREMTIAVTGIH